MTAEYHSFSDSKPADNSHSNHPVNQTPEELRSTPQWMGSIFEERADGKIDKPPYRVRPGQPLIKADKRNPENWTTFEEALQAYEAGKVDAVGFVLSDTDPFVIADGDSVIDSETGEIDPNAAEVIHALGTYTERSCSGEGFHAIAKGKKPSGARCKSKALGFGLEVYDRARFVVLTGNRIGPHTTAMERQKELADLCKKLWPDEDKAKFSNRSEKPQPVALDDLELLERARRSRTRAKFRKLYDYGDTSGYVSASEADFGLIRMLIFWCAGERDRIVRLFKSSALFRKEKGRNYVEGSTNKALAGYVGKFYRPRSVQKARQEEPEDPLTPYLKLLLDPSRWVGRKGASAFKAYAAAVILAAENGVVTDDEGLRIGCDLRRLAEVAGTTLTTLSRSALPHLTQELGLMKWQRGKGRQAGSFLLPKPVGNVGDDITYNTKVFTHFSVISYVTPEQQLKTLRLLVRMRSGHCKHATVLRLGMPAMFTAVALVAGGVRREQSIRELSDNTGRRASDLRRVLKHLKGAGVVREASEDVFRLTDDFAAEYERSLERSGITYSERAQRRRHADDRKRRDAKLPVDKRNSPLRGKEKVRTLVRDASEREHAARLEEQRRKVGLTAETFVADNLRGVSGFGWRELKLAWVAKGGRTDDLARAVRSGPWELTREADGALYVYKVDESPTEDQRKRIRQLVSQGMKEKFARAEVLKDGAVFGR